MEWLRAMSLVAVSACGPGDGSLLDPEGRPIDKPWAPPQGSRYGAVSFAPTFSGIRSGFFVRFCAECHAGAAAPKGLDLSGPGAYDQLVRVPSVQRPGMSRVEPGRPTESYLVRKLAGGPGISGDRMPRNRPARPQAEIDRISAWIQAGAPRD